MALRRRRATVVLSGVLWLVMAAGVEGELARDLAGGGVDDGAVEVLDQESDVGSGVGSADADADVCRRPLWRRVRSRATSPSPCSTARPADPNTATAGSCFESPRLTIMPRRAHWWTTAGW